MGYVGPITQSGSVAWGAATLSLAVCLGLAIGGIRVRGVKLGVSGVLFAALLFGQLGITVDRKVLEFLRDFALITFVYAIGLQVGPGFLTSLRAEGLRLNVLSLAVVVLGAALTGAVTWAARLPRESASGLYAGAYTTTPGLAAGQEALRHAMARHPETADAAAAAAGLAYTVTYPFGIIGPVGVIVLLRRMFRVRIEQERADLLAAERVRRPPIDVVDFEISESEHVGKILRDIPLLREHHVVLSRLLRDDTLRVPTGDTELRAGDVFRAVGPRAGLAEVIRALGRTTKRSIPAAAGDIRRMELLVTRTRVLRRPLRDLDLIRRAGVTFARVNRAGVHLLPKASLRLQFGDRVTAVGTEAGLKLVEDELGNCPETLNRPQLVPIFLGIALGVLVGSMPLTVPGLHTQLRIGLAGGPMLAAIALSQLGNIGSVVWYMPVAANQLFRDFGLAVFLACVGLQAGDHFIERLTHGGGLAFVAWGAAITVLPVLLVGFVARRFL